MKMRGKNDSELTKKPKDGKNKAVNILQTTMLTRHIVKQLWNNIFICLFRKMT